MKHPKFLLLAACVLAALLCAGVLAYAAMDEMGFVRTTPEEIQWRDVPNAPGLQVAVLAGDPAKPGLYVVRAKFAPGVMTRNHFHPDERHVVVLKGTWYAGAGDDFAPDKTIGLKPGSYVRHPAQEHHFDGSKDEEVIVQIVGIGPSGTTLLRPAEGLTGRSH